MHKRIIVPIISVIVVILLVATVLGITYLNNQESARRQNASESQRMTTQDTTSVKTEDNTPNPDAAQKPQATTAGKYVNYSEDIITNTSGKKVLFFHAPWCPQCRQIDAEIKAQTNLPADTTIIKVDYDSHQSLRQKYGITLQTTFVKVDDNGDSLQKYVAYNEPTYEAVKQNILE